MISVEDNYDLRIFGWEEYLGFGFFDLELTASLRKSASFEWIMIEVYESLFVVRNTRSKVHKCSIDDSCREIGFLK